MGVIECGARPVAGFQLGCVTSRLSEMRNRCGSLKWLGCVQDTVTRAIRDGGEVPIPEERIAVEAALRAVTLDAAWQGRMDDITGSLETGTYADLAWLEEDPTTVDPVDIEKIMVSGTWLAGTVRHGA